MSVVNVWVGATTSSSATVVAKVAGSSVRLVVAESADLASPIFFGPVVPSTDGIARLSATGLATNGRYYFVLEVDGVRDTAYPGQFRTHPPLALPAVPVALRPTRRRSTRPATPRS